MTTQNHYAVLGVLRESSYSQVKTAYNRLVLTHHPDKGGQQAVFVKIQKAWEVLRNAAARAVFDMKYPAATGAPGSPDLTVPSDPIPEDARKSTSNTPHSQSFKGNKFNTESGANACNSFRESAGGNAHWGYSSGASPSGTSEHGRFKYKASRSRFYPTNQGNSQSQEPGGRYHADQPLEPKDTPMSDSTDYNNYNEEDRYSQADHDSSSGPAPTWETGITPIEALADLAQRTLTDYVSIVGVLRDRTSHRAPLPQQIQLKLQQVYGYLCNHCERLRLRMDEVQTYNAHIRVRTQPPPLTAFFPMLENSILHGDIDKVAALQVVMERVIKDTGEIAGRTSMFKPIEPVLSEDEAAWRASMDELDRVLTTVLARTPRVGTSLGC
jgi:curved DNA-binding protein CbpA